MDAYPAEFQLDAPAEVANWRPLVHWLLAVPHLIIAEVLSSVGSVVALISWFAIVFTGRLPEGLAGLQCLSIRYQARTYTYAFFLRESYPAFEFPMTFADPGTDPVRIVLAPELENRNRLTVGLRFLWILPIAIFTGLVTLVASLAVFAAFFAVLFTGRWPDALRRFVLGTGRLVVRISTYGGLLVDRYPPFSLD